MGLLDSVMGALGQGGSSQPDLLQAVIAMLTQGGGAGLGGLVSQLQQGGLADIVNSWVSTGPNMPVSPGQLEGALGSDLISGLARQLGQSHGDVAGGLSQLLPQIIDQLTPHGRVPEGGLGDMASLLANLMRR